MFQCHQIKVKKAKIFYNGHHYTYVALTDVYGKIEANRFEFADIWILAYQEKFPHGGHVVNYSTVDAIGNKVLMKTKVVYYDPSKDNLIPLNTL